MLKALWFRGKRYLYKHPLVRRHLPRLSTFQAFLSTNTAINQSLRKSQYEGTRPKKGFSGREAGHGFLGRDLPREQLRRPNHQQGLDVENIESSTTKNEPYKAWKPAKRAKERGQELRVALSKRPTSQAEYDYAPNPKGNRAARRAAKFGHLPKAPAVATTSPMVGRATEMSSRRSDSCSVRLSRLSPTSRRALDRNTSYGGARRVVGRVRANYPSSRPAEWEQDQDGNRGLSMPENVRDDSRTFSEHPRRTLTMVRRDDRSNGNTPAHSVKDTRFERPSSQRESDTSLNMPYTTPASEFLYGTSVVVAALLSSRRKLYKLYIYDGDGREVRSQDMRIQKLAVERNVVVEKVKGRWLKLMDRTSMGRPHNLKGYILEASPLPKLPVLGFRAVDKRQGGFDTFLDHQSREDEAINGTDTQIKYDAGFPRYPLVLLLDGILDPGNLGAILRTAFFIGVDAIAISNRSSAPLSPVALKASAGASENLPLVSVNQTGKFLDKCSNHGWKIYAAVAPSSGKPLGKGRYLSMLGLGNPVRHHPCILVLGGEGGGLHWNIQSKADFTVGIEGRRQGQGKVDSLNVSVATGLLCEAFLREPVILRKAGVDASVRTDSWSSEENEGSNGDLENRMF